MTIKKCIEIKDEIINYYSNHTTASTCKKYDISRGTFYKFLDLYDIIRHDSSISEILKHIELDKYDNLTMEQIETIYETYNLLNEIEETCEKCNIKEYFLVYLLQNRNIEIKHRDSKILDIETFDSNLIRDIIDFYLAPNTLIDTAEKFNLKSHNIKRILELNNIELHSKEITEQLGKAKQHKNLQLKYGVDNVFQLESTKEKITKTKIARYNDAKYTNKEQAKQTFLEKYGATSFLGSDLGKEAIKNYSKQAYGTDYAFQSLDWQNSVKQKSQKTRENNKYNLKNYSQLYLDVYQNKEALSNLIKDKTIYEIANILNIDRNQAYYLVTKNNLLDIVKKDYVAHSHYEFELIEFIGEDLCTLGDRTVLKGKEIDIYIPTKNIGIEFNGTRWHSTEINPDKKYHFNKSIEAEKAGIRLIHIWEYEWEDPIQREKIKLMLNIALGRNKDKIYARNCVVRQITNTEAKQVNEKYHLQGHRNARVTYGLFYKDELVQIMSFSPSKYNKNLQDNEWEIIRGCPGSNNIVVGGVSKLLKHFIRDYKPSSIFSYCDFNKFDGKSYIKAGMSFIGYTGPDMKWVLSDYTVVNRQPKKHAELKKQAIAQIFGAGSKKFVLKIS